MRPYEVMVILEPDLEEQAIDGALERAVELLSSRGAEVVRVEHWGRRRFAYELRRRTEGYYVLLEVRSEPAAVAELERMLSLADEVVRHKVIRVPDAVVARAAAAAGAGPDRASRQGTH